MLRRELLLVQDVAKVDIFGDRPEVIYVQLDRDRVSQLGIPVTIVAQELQRAVVRGHREVEVAVPVPVASNINRLEKV